MSKGLKVTFLIHFIVAIFSAIGMLFFPAMFMGWMGWTSGVAVPLVRLQGTMMLAFAISSWLGYRATEAQQVKLIVTTEVWLTVVGTLVSLYGVVLDGAPAMMWGNVIVFAIFAVLWIVFYPKTKS